MLLRCWEFREHINCFLRKLKTTASLKDNDLAYGPLTSMITAADWKDVKDLIDFLETPYQLTKRLEGNNGGNSQGLLWQTLLNLQVLWVHFEEAKLSDHSE
jgi:hypothetical protein